MLKATGAVEKVTSRVTDRWIIWSKEMPERMLRRSRIFVIANTVVLSIVVAAVFFEFIATSLLQDSRLFRTQPWVDAQIPLFLLWSRLKSNTATYFVSIHFTKRVDFATLVFRRIWTPMLICKF